MDDIDALALTVQHAGHDISWDPDFPGYRRFHTSDPHGNRVEVLATAVS